MSRVLPLDSKGPRARRGPTPAHIFQGYPLFVVMCLIDIVLPKILERGRQINTIQRQPTGRFFRAVPLSESVVFIPAVSCFPSKLYGWCVPKAGNNCYNDCINHLKRGRSHIHFHLFCPDTAIVSDRRRRVRVLPRLCVARVKRGLADRCAGLFAGGGVTRRPRFRPRIGKTRTEAVE